MVHMRLNELDNELSKPQKKKGSTYAFFFRTWNKTEFQIFHIGLSHVTQIFHSWSHFRTINLSLSPLKSLSVCSILGFL